MFECIVVFFVGLAVYGIYIFVLTEEVCHEEWFDGYTGIPKIPIGIKQFSIYEKETGKLLFRHTKIRKFKSYAKKTD